MSYRIVLRREYGATGRAVQRGHVLSEVMVAWAGDGWEMVTSVAAAAAADALEKMDLRSVIYAMLSLGSLLPSSFFNVYLEVDAREEKVGTTKADDDAQYASSSAQILLIVVDLLMIDENTYSAQ
mmetsp:Transcript_13032/g.18986  ORF Transcript_13032/g.18986 Transcript_13032/m.18986 type:complete len:125 (+) Transcript_13032:1231-1605(+)